MTRCYIVRKLKTLGMMMTFSLSTCRTLNAEADPRFFLGGDAPLRNDVTDRLGKQILKANTKKASPQGGMRSPALFP